MACVFLGKEGLTGRVGGYAMVTKIRGKGDFFLGEEEVERRNGWMDGDPGEKTRRGNWSAGGIWSKRGGVHATGSGERVKLAGRSKSQGVDDGSALAGFARLFVFAYFALGFGFLRWFAL